MMTIDYDERMVRKRERKKKHMKTNTTRIKIVAQDIAILMN